MEYIKSLKVMTDKKTPTYKDIALMGTVDFTLGTNWIKGDDNLYYQNVTISTITPNTEGILGIDAQNAGADVYKAAAKAQIVCTSQSNGAIVIKCYGANPPMINGSLVAVPCHITSIYEAAK